MGGENDRPSIQHALRDGSSPRGRGKREADVARWLGSGLIPAWAGKTWETSAASPTGRAHPRVGGENGTIAGARLSASGSSPRGRGKLR